MDFKFNDILSALGQIKGSLPARRFSTRIRLGEHKSIFYGPSYDLYDIQEYDPDRDRVSDIIWSLYDPSEKIIWVRRTIEQHEVKVNFLVDLSSSLDVGVDFNKRKILLETIGFIGITAARYQDPVGLVGFNDRVVLNLTPRCGVNNFYYLLKTAYDYLAEQESKKEKRGTDFFAMLDFVRKSFNKPCFIPVISDFVGFENVLSSSALRTAASRHEMVFIFLDDPLEFARNSGWGYLRVEDIETGQSSMVSRRKMRKSDLELRQRRKALRKELRRIGIDSVVLEPGKHFKRLYRFFQARHKIRSSR